MADRVIKYRVEMDTSQAELKVKQLGKNTREAGQQYGPVGQSMSLINRGYMPWRNQLVMNPPIVQANNNLNRYSAAASLLNARMPGLSAAGRVAGPAAAVMGGFAVMDEFVRRTKEAVYDTPKILDQEFGAWVGTTFVEMIGSGLHRALDILTGGMADDMLKGETANMSSRGGRSKFEQDNLSDSELGGRPGGRIGWRRIGPGIYVPWVDEGDDFNNRNMAFADKYWEGARKRDEERRSGRRAERRHDAGRLVSDVFRDIGGG